MKGRYTRAILAAIAVAFLIGLSDSAYKTLYATDPPLPLSSTCGVWFPFVSYDGVDYDTGITITGNVAEGNTDMWICFYGLDGSLVGGTHIENLDVGEHSQWTGAISEILPEGVSTFSGPILVATKMTDVRACGFITDINYTRAFSETPAIIDYSITGVGANRRITGFPEPEESRTALVFPYFLFTGEGAYDTAIRISGPYYSGCSGCTATLFLYDTGGILRRKVVVNMDPTVQNPGVHATFNKRLSEILDVDPQSPQPPFESCEDFNGGFGEGSAEGFIIAVLNFPYAQGCEFALIPNIGLTAGFAATVDNDIYIDEESEKPKRHESEVAHSAIVLPFVHTNVQSQGATFITLAQTCNDGGDIVVDAYLLGLDGNILMIGEEPCWEHWEVDGESEDMPAMDPLFLWPEEFGDFTGWMLIITNAPGTYATATVATAANACMSYAGQNDADIIDFDLEGGTGIVRDNPLPLDAVEAVAVPHFASVSGPPATFSTYVNVLSTADWYAGGSGEPFPYTVLPYEYDGDALEPLEPVELNCPLVLSASGGQQVPDGGSPQTYGNCVALGPPNLTAMGFLVTAYDFAGIPGTPIPPPSGVDLDVDSDNDNGYDPPDRSSAEDLIEHIPPGKIVVVNDNDIDNDGVDDFADGFNFDTIPNNEDDVLTGGQFAPLVIELLPQVDVSEAKIKFIYPASDPAGVVKNLDGTYTPAEGQLRIWTKNGNEYRNKTSVVGGLGHFVPDDVAITPVDIGLTSETRSVTLYVEAIDGTCGTVWVKAKVSPEGGEDEEDYTMIDSISLAPVYFDLDVDTNRDGIINNHRHDDETAEDQWTDDRGAIILPNCDKDSGPGTKGPDNWPGGDWDFVAGDELPNKTVDAGNDKDDIGPLYIPRLGDGVKINKIPPNLKLTLSVANPLQGQEHAFFHSTPATRRVRIFMPTFIDTSHQNKDLIIQEGDEEIIGPSTSNSVEFVVAPEGTQKNVNIFVGRGKVKFGIEGIEMGAMVDITLTAQIGNKIISTDKVRMRVAPFILLDHTCPVDGSGTSVFITLRPWLDNSELVGALEAKYGARLLKTGIADIWQQDGYEVGYAKAPYGALPVVLVSPRACGWIDEFVHNTILDSGVGVCWRIEDIIVAPEYLTSFDSFGNIECKPVPSELGKWFYGESLNNNIENFFKAQAVNTPVAEDVNTNWLLVGHVDEVVSFTPDTDPDPDKRRVVVADPEVCWALLLWAKSIEGGGTAVMHIGMNDNGAGGKTVNAVIDAPSGIPKEEEEEDKLRDFNLLSSDSRYVMHADNLPQIRNTTLALPSPETTTVADGGNTGSGALSKGGAFVAFFPNNNRRYYRITFTSETDYSLEYKEEGGEWTADGSGTTTEDEVFTTAKCFIFTHWWSGTPAAGDKFTFEADPTCTTIEMPVLFEYVPDEEHPLGGGAVAYTIDHVNSLVDGTTVVTGDAHGPKVKYTGPEDPLKDILADYVAAAFARAGYTTVTIADSRGYHDGMGDIHCGTNVRRSIPSYNWWEK